MKSLPWAGWKRSAMRRGGNRIVSFASDWLRRPQSTGARKALFQAHLWAGLLLGFYVAVVCASGSSVVFRNDIYRILSDKLRVVPNGQPLSREQLTGVLQRAHPGYELDEVKPGRDGQEASEVTMSQVATLEVTRSRRDRRLQRLVNPYTGEDRGPAISPWFRLFEWLSNVHGSLLLGPSGMTANAIGGGLVACFCLTGIAIWWPGVGRWRRGLTIDRGLGWKRMIRDLHGAVGIWVFGFLFMWGMTGFSFVFPQPFRATVTLFASPNPSVALNTQGPSEQDSSIPRRPPLTPSGKVLHILSLAHYGNFAGWPLKALWALLGLAPAGLYFSALLTWWNRVVSPAMRPRDERIEMIPEPMRGMQV
jgi:uncharacterized iron-regulated membrane protein